MQVKTLDFAYPDLYEISTTFMTGDSDRKVRRGSGFTRRTYLAQCLFFKVFVFPLSSRTKRMLASGPSPSTGRSAIIAYVHVWLERYTNAKS